MSKSFHVCTNKLHFSSNNKEIRLTLDVDNAIE